MAERKKAMNSRILFAACACVCAFASAASEADKGGTVRLAGKGRLAIVDCRSGLDWSEMKPALDSFNSAFHVDVVMQRGGPFSVEGAAAAVAAAKSNAALFVGSRDDYPMSLAAPEQKWAFVNVAPLRLDGANFAKRCQVLLTRGMYRALGSDTSQAANSCLSPVYSPADLDKISDLGVAMDTYMAIGLGLDALGIVPVEYGTYEEACMTGVAPPPTNAVQKAIWDKVHAIPKNPMKIEFDPKKGR